MSENNEEIAFLRTKQIYYIQAVIYCDIYTKQNICFFIEKDSFF